MVKTYTDHSAQLRLLVQHLDVPRRLAGEYSSQGAMFIALDTEKFEKDHGPDPRMTEVGVSVMDTRDLHGLSTDDNAKAWRNMIKTRHFRIEENKRLRNTLFCPGDPEAFHFNSSEFVRKRDIAGILKGLCVEAAREGAHLRPVVFVGHAVENDARDMALLNVRTCPRI